jgi:hypothetical protein
MDFRAPGPGAPSSIPERTSSSTEQETFSIFTFLELLVGFLDSDPDKNLDPWTDCI